MEVNIQSNWLNHLTLVLKTYVVAMKLGHAR